MEYHRQNNLDFQKLKNITNLFMLECQLRTCKKMDSQLKKTVFRDLCHCLLSFIKYIDLWISIKKLKIELCLLFILEHFR